MYILYRSLRNKADHVQHKDLLIIRSGNEVLLRGSTKPSQVESKVGMPSILGGMVKVNVACVFSKSKGKGKGKRSRAVKVKQWKVNASKCEMEHVGNVQSKENEIKW